MLTAEFGTKLLKKALEVPANVGSQIVALPQVAARIDHAYHAAKVEHRARLPELSKADTQIVDGLEAKGVFQTSLDILDLDETAEMFATARALADHYHARSVSGEITQSFQADAHDVMQNKAIFLWGLNDRLLRIAEVYLGLPVAYDGINIFYTKADGRQSAARRWHRDTEDRRMVKVAVYLNDVDEAGGPLQLLHRTVPGKNAWSGKFPILTDEALAARLGAPVKATDVTTCVGPAGTVVFADTAALYHRGKPATGRDRCAVYFNYFSRIPLRPFRCERSTISRAEIDALAAGLPTAQRESLLWRKSLPLVARLIPPAPIW